MMPLATPTRFKAPTHLTTFQRKSLKNSNGFSYLKVQNHKQTKGRIRMESTKLSNNWSVCSWEILNRNKVSLCIPNPTIFKLHKSKITLQLSITKCSIFLEATMARRIIVISEYSILLEIVG
jgi:hypothetical protein